LTQITGEAEFNEIFFTDVEVPVENVVGQPGDGWQVAMTTLMHERAALGFALSGAFEVAVNKLLELAGGRELDDRLRDRIAETWIELQALKWTNYRALTRLIDTGAPGPEASIPKLHWSEANQRLGKLALELLGPEAQVMDGDGFWQWLQLRSRGNTIEAGTSEILRNIVAERVLGLPKGR
jgi:alkylation response protein AidB-like acyl-CoA dehydrogenase